MTSTCNQSSATIPLCPAYYPLHDAVILSRMKKLIPLIGLLLLAACTQMSQPTGTLTLTRTPTNTPEPSPSFTSAPPLVDSRATADALFAQVTLNLPTGVPTQTATSTLDPSFSPTPTPSRDTDFEYSTGDRPDDSDLFQIHFIYAIPSDGEDKHRDINGEIELSANAANYWLSQQTGGASLRYDTIRIRGNLTSRFCSFPSLQKKWAHWGG